MNCEAHHGCTETIVMLMTSKCGSWCHVNYWNKSMWHVVCRSKWHHW